LVVVLGVGAGVALGELPELLPEDDPIEPDELEPVLPEPLVLPPMLLPEVLPDPLPYWRTQSSFSVPVLPAHWLGSAALSVLELPDTPAPVEPLELEPALPPTLGLVVEPPVVLPELCAQDALARPSSAAATAAVSVFAITLNLLRLD
jgi:hypothetical protein